MAQIKLRRRPEIDYPSGRGAGGSTAAGVNTVDRRLGATPISFRLRGASGQPSSSADSGYSRSTVQRVNRGYEDLKAEEDVPEISWLKQNAEQMNAMGLTPRVVVEMYHMLQSHKPRSADERRVISEMNRRVLQSRRNVRQITRLALHEGAVRRRRQINEFAGVDDFLDAGKSFLGAGSDEEGVSSEPSEDEQYADIASLGDPDLSGDEITASEVDELANEENITSGVLACNSHSLEIFQTFLAVTGVVGDIGAFFAIPIGVAADLTNACINLICRNYFYAFLDLVAVVPFVGDLSKILYAKRLIKTLGLTGDMNTIRSGVSVSVQVEDASRIIDTILADPTMGVKVSKKILSLKNTFKTAEQMSTRLGNLLMRVLNRAIKYIEDIHKAAADGNITSKAASWIFSKMPIDVLTIFRKIRTEGVPGIKEFIVKLFGRKSVQQTVSAAQVKHAVVDNLEDVDGTGSTDEFPEEPSLTSFESNSHIYGLFDDVDNNGVDDAKQNLGSAPTGAVVGEGRKRKGKVKSPAKKLSLKNAMAGDDSAVDETSTVAGSLGTPGEPGAGGYITPLGMKPSGSKRKTLDQLIPGYEFVGGGYPYSR